MQDSFAHVRQKRKTKISLQSNHVIKWINNSHEYLIYWWNTVDLQILHQEYKYERYLCTSTKSQHGYETKSSIFMNNNHVWKHHLRPASIPIYSIIRKSNFLFHFQGEKERVGWVGEGVQPSYVYFFFSFDNRGVRTNLGAPRLIPRDTCHLPPASATATDTR